MSGIYLFNVGGLCLNDLVHPGPEPAEGHLHHVLVHDGHLLLDGGDQRGLCSVMT